MIVWSLAICICLGIITIFAGRQLQGEVLNIVSSGGLPAYFVVLVAIHVLILPILPDPIVALAPILFSRSYWLALVLSATAPVVAAWIDLYLGQRYGRSLLQRMGGGKTMQTGEHLASRYGAYSVLASGVLPLNFSLLCWTCGILKVSRAQVIAAVIVTRVPRYVLVGVFGSQMLRKLFHWL